MKRKTTFANSAITPIIANAVISASAPITNTTDNTP